MGRVLQGRGLPIHQYSRGAPYTVEADDKRRVRLNRICYVLDQIPYKHVIPGKIKRPKRKEQGEYQRPPQSNLTAAPKNIEVFLHRPVCKTHPYL